MRWTGLLALAVLATASSRALADPSPPKAVGTHSCADSYPKSALNEGLRGNTSVVFRIGADGIPADLRVEHSSGSTDLDQAALSCVSAWRYEPARSADGKPVAASWESNVVWNLETVLPLPKPGAPHNCMSYTPSADEREHATSPAQMDFVVEPDGSVNEPSIALSSGSKTFDKAALQCVTGWQYLPATRNAQPVAVGWGARIALQHGVPAVSENFGKPHLCFYYPKQAYRDHVEGTAVLSFQITARGAVDQPSVTQSSGSKELDDASIACSGHWKYIPATRDGTPIAVPWQAQVTWRAGYAFVLELPATDRI